MKRSMFLASLTALALVAATPAAAQTPAVSGDRIATNRGELVIRPVSHASFVMTYGGKVIYVDPVGGVDPYLELPKPDLIVITDIHGDHMHPATLNALVGPTTPIMAPAAVRAALPANLQSRVILLQNGQSTTWSDIGFEAVPMYNITEGRLQNHPKGRGNGYVMTFGDKRVYVAGDTEATDEMKALRNIDVAFVPMNLPFTMTPQQAAEGVRAFRPRVVYPYHHRGSDVAEFARLVGADVGVEVRQRAWYPTAAQ
jgi:L-ascorbate metabolism protein UlaG (beta-lactamase superfamily)